MALDAIDRLIEDWEERLRRVDENLLALESEPTYQMLAPRAAPRPVLEGETERVVGPALDALAQLFEHRGRLTDVVDRAKDLRASMRGLALWGNDQKELSIRALLDGPSIALPPEGTPLSRRALLDPASREVRIRPQDLLAAMAAAFDGARDAVFAVKEAWARIEPALTLLAARLADARVASQELAVEAAVAEMAAVERGLEAVRARTGVDPLGAVVYVDGRLGPRVDALAARLGEVAAQRDRIRSGLARARALCEELGQVHAAAQLAVVRMPAEIAGARAAGAPTDGAHVEGLAPWLSKIEQAAVAGRWHSAEVGLARWLHAADGYLANDGKIARALAAVIARREELAGRLSARRAQAGALAGRGAGVPSEAESIAREAEALLGQRPTPLARAAELVERYEALVSRAPGARAP
jgi:hypothetical protein